MYNNDNKIILLIYSIAWLSSLIVKQRDESFNLYEIFRQANSGLYHYFIC